MNALTSKYPTQAVLMNMYGFNKYALADKMRNHFHIPDNYLQALRVYRMAHFSGDYLKCVVDGQIRYSTLREVIHYNVIYHNCTPYNAKRAKEIRLSFRAAQNEFNLEPIVLVEIVIASDQGELL